MPKTRKFNYDQDFDKINFRKNPEKYEIGRGEQGVLLVEPYKSEILPFWRFKTVPIALESAKKIYSLFKSYKKQKDFVGMDMSRKFLQMGYTRARRYANHPSGRKYKVLRSGKKEILPQSKDWNTGEKAEAARIFYGYYKKTKEDKVYLRMKNAFLASNLTT